MVGVVGGSDIALPCEMFLVGGCLQVNFLRTAVHEAQPHFFISVFASLFTTSLMFGVACKSLLF